MNIDPLDSGKTKVDQTPGSPVPIATDTCAICGRCKAGQGTECSRCTIKEDARMKRVLDI